VNAVIDASVAVKWFVPDRLDEPAVDAAATLLERIGDEQIDVLQPPHWCIEVAAVLARLRPEIVDRAVDLLDAMDLPIDDDASTLKRATALTAALGQHVFDTLYHAVALERGATLITADTRYYRIARRQGCIVLLDEWARRS
jgi:predicted nucleic acid-binding protein